MDIDSGRGVDIQNSGTVVVAGGCGVVDVKLDAMERENQRAESSWQRRRPRQSGGISKHGAQPDSEVVVDDEVIITTARQNHRTDNDAVGVHERQSVIASRMTMPPVSNSAEDDEVRHTSETIVIVVPPGD